MSKVLEERAESGNGFTVLDGAGMVIGAAVAAVHLRQSVPETLAGPGWALLWLTFAGVAITATGPPISFLRYLRERPSGKTWLGDRLWTLLGAPWVLMALVRAASSEGLSENVQVDLLELYTLGLSIGIGSASILTLGIVWSTWVMVPPGRINEPEEPTPWTHKVGLTLAVAWPLQCGFGLIVLGNVF